MNESVALLREIVAMLTADREAAAQKAAQTPESRYWALPTYPMMPFAPGVPPGVTPASELQNRHQPEPEPEPDTPPEPEPEPTAARKRPQVWL